MRRDLFPHVAICCLKPSRGWSSGRLFEVKVGEQIAPFLMVEKEIAFSVKDGWSPWCMVNKSLVGRLAFYRDDSFGYYGSHQIGVWWGPGYDGIFAHLPSTETIGLLMSVHLFVGFGMYILTVHMNRTQSPRLPSSRKGAASLFSTRSFLPRSLQDPTSNQDMFPLENRSMPGISVALELRMDHIL